MTQCESPDSANPLVTAYIPLYNHQRFIGKAIEGMLNQTYLNIELIVINDGSSDYSDEVVKQYIEECKNRFVRFLYVNRENKGLSNTINEALAWSSGVYIGGCASDDYWATDKIESQVRFLEENLSYNGCGSGYTVVDEDDRPLSIKGKGRSDYTFKDCLIDARQPRAITLLWRKEVFDIVGLYSTDTRIEDWDFMLRVLKKGMRVANLDKALAYYRSHTYNTMKQLDLIDSEECKILSKYSTDKYYKLAMWHASLRQAKRRLSQGKYAAFDPKWIPAYLTNRKVRKIVSLYIKTKYQALTQNL